MHSRKHQLAIVALVCGILCDSLAAQQTPVPANFGAQPAPQKGNWLTRKLPWKKDGKPAPAPQSRPLPPKQVSPQQQRKGRLAMGRLAERRDQTDAAQAIYKSLIESNPKDYAPYHRLGVMEARAGRFNESAAYLQQARKLAPKNVEVLRDLGYLCYKSGQVETAEKFYKAALAVEPKHQGTLNNYAMLLAETQRFKESLELFKRGNEPAEAHSNMGYMLIQLGYIDKAQKYFSHALTLDKDLKSAAHGLIQSAQLRDHVEALKAKDELQKKKLAEGKGPASNATDAIASKESEPLVTRAALTDESTEVKRVAQVGATETPAQPAAQPPAQPAAMAKRIQPIRVNDAIESIDSRRIGEPQTLRPIPQPTQRRAVAIATAPQQEPAATSSDSIRSQAGPVRQRNTIRIRSNSPEPTPQEAAVKAAGAQQTPAAAAGSTHLRTPAKAPSTRTPRSRSSLRDSRDFNWSTTKYPTALPTWTPTTDASKTEVPANLAQPKQ